MNTDITKQMEMVLYRTEDDNVTVSALIKDETIWLTQKAMAELFGIDKSGISRHLAKIGSGCCKNCNNHSARSNAG